MAAEVGFGDWRPNVPRTTESWRAAYVREASDFEDEVLRWRFEGCAKCLTSEDCARLGFAGVLVEGCASAASGVRVTAAVWRGDSEAAALCGRAETLDVEVSEAAASRISSE